MNIRQIRAEAARVAVEHFGEPVIINGAGMPAWIVHGVFQPESNTVFDNGAKVETVALWFLFRECDFTGRGIVCKRDTITHDDKDYSVVEVHPTGSGMLRMRVHECDPSRFGGVQGVAF